MLTCSFYVTVPLNRSYKMLVDDLYEIWRHLPLFAIYIGYVGLGRVSRSNTLPNKPHGQRIFYIKLIGSKKEINYYDRNGMVRKRNRR